MSRRTVDHETARRAAIVATIWIPLAIVIVAEIVVIAVGASGGGDLIVHWGSGPDRTGPWWAYAVLVGATGFPVVALFGYFVVRGTRMSGMNAWMPAIAMGVTVFHAGGVVTRRGPALEVVRRDGRSIVVTVDEAATAAAVLETCATS